MHMPALMAPPTTLVHLSTQHRDLLHFAEELYPAFSAGQREDQPTRWAAIAQGMRSRFPFFEKVTADEVRLRQRADLASQGGTGHCAPGASHQRDGDTEKRTIREKQSYT